MINLLLRRAGPDADQPPTYPVLSENRVVYAIGDIHGRSELLDRVHAAIDAADLDGAQDITEVYLGDYVDRGQDSRGVIERLIERRTHRDVVCLRGNHEAMFENFLHGQLSIKDWQPAGGVETLLSYGVDPRALAQAPNDDWIEATLRQVPAAHHRFVLDLVDSHRIGDYFFAHAGVRPLVALEDQSPDDLMWIRDAFLGFRSAFGAIVVHGHTPTVDVDFQPNRINIDTGAYITSRLTCLRIDADGPRVFEH